jgi:hypothetical protein
MAVLDTNPAMTTASVVVLSRRGVESKGLRGGLCLAMEGLEMAKEGRIGVLRFVEDRSKCERPATNY